MAAKTKDTTPRADSPAITAIFVLAALGLAAALAIGFLRSHPPTPYFEPPAAADSQVPVELIFQVNPAKIARVQETILDQGSRLVGQPGAVATADLIEREFRAAGLETLVHDDQTAAPVTERSDFYVQTEAGDQSAPGVELFPFLPNHMQPATTPGDGVTGELVLLDSQTLANRESFDGVIGVVDATPGAYDANFAFNWLRYARLGLEAIIIASPEGFEAIEWSSVADMYTGMVSSAPVNFPRMAASPEIFDHLGETVRVDLKVRWKNQPNKTVLGVVRGDDSAKEAILVLVRYDSGGILPDRALGGMEALETAYLIQLAKGLAPFNGQLERDVILAGVGGMVNGLEGNENLLRMLRFNYGNQPGKRNTAPEFDAQISYREQPIIERRNQNQAKLDLVNAILPQFDNPAFLTDAAATRALIDQLPSEASAFLREQSTFVIKNTIMEASEEVLQAKIKFERLETIDPESQLFQDYQTIREGYVDINNLAGLTLLSAVERKSPLLRELNYRGRLEQRFQELSDFHEYKKRQYRQELEIVNLFDTYREFTVVHPLFGAGEDADSLERLQFTPPDRAQLASQKEKHGILNNIVNARRKAGAKVAMAPFDERMWPQLQAYAGDEQTYLEYMRGYRGKGYDSYFLVNLDRAPAYTLRHAPFIPGWMRNVDSLDATLWTTTEFIYELARGAGTITAIELQEYRIWDFGGRVLASGIGNSIVPNHPLEGALISNRPRERSGVFNLAGYFRHPFLIADPYGEYEMFESTADFAVNWRVYTAGRSHNPLAATFDDDGLINYIKDEGSEGQRQFKSVNVSIDNTQALKDVTIVCFRAAPVTLLDLNNPQTMRDYVGVRFVTAEGLTDFRKSLKFEAIGLQQFFIEPDRRFYALLQSGEEGNENVRKTRAFMTNVEGTPAGQLEGEISGRGYLAADNPILNRVPFRSADAMLYTNGQRLALQNRHKMADERVNLYHERAENLLAEAKAPGQPFPESNRLARDSVVYSTLNHPVLRDSIAEAVWGILWYLFLMVPFIFFFEKLIFCFADTRKQVVAQIGIFLVCFALLRVLHPAFEMVRSSLMILLGFVIILISGGITFLFSSKFKENLEELRKKAGKVTAAEVNKAGVLGSAFMLGLNNMHRRKVRTGLTCGTLVLLTFVMISFTSVQNDLVDESIPLGKANYQGILVRKDDFRKLSNAEVFAFQKKFGGEYIVARRNLLVGSPDEMRGEQKTPEIRLISNTEGRPREAIIQSFLKFDVDEPLRDQIEFLASDGWFTPGDLISPRMPIMISDATAGALGISPAMVEAGEATVTINGASYDVKGVFVADSLENLRDLNGDDLLPFDLERVSEYVSTSESGTEEVRVDESEPRVPAANVIITPFRPIPFKPASGEEVTISAAVAMPEAGFREASEVIEAFLIQTGEPAYYGLDGVAYRGLKTRQASLAGLVDLIIPLLIAGLTVLNTMKGSVYERRDEIFVYNAVGIAPRYVFFMFIAESFVYAVVGSVLGYIMSQGVGRVLTELDMTGGLNMTYTSMTTIYASWTIMAAVFISTYFPAKQAMEISAPSDDAGWDVPEPDGDELAFDLPFNFRHRGRYAILAFFNRFLSEHGEGSAGRFFAGPPEVGLAPDLDRPGERIPFIEARIWLKPFDLGVSQLMRIEMPVDEETGFYKARLHLIRQSGTFESWTRLNKGLVQQLRRQFLHWRAVPETDRDELFEEARDLLKASLDRINARNETPELATPATP